MKRSTKSIYAKLAAIKRPVLIEVEPVRKQSVYQPRYRILYPDGRCEYDYLYLEGLYENGKFIQSCFSYTDGYGDAHKTLKETVKGMKRYDSNSMKITKVVAL